jgi:hypothetical protein
MGLFAPWVPSLQLNSKEVFSLTSFALSLLLVFRTNASYERWDGARKMWGLVLNRSRDFVRQGLTYFPENRPELKEMLVGDGAWWATALLSCSPNALGVATRSHGPGPAVFNSPAVDLSHSQQLTVPQPLPPRSAGPPPSPSL